MTVSSILTYILCLVLIAFTLFNLYALLTSKRKKALSNQSYAASMAPIEKKLLEIQKQRGVAFDKVKRMVNDQNEAIILVSDSKQRIAAIGMKDDTLIFPFSEIVDVKKEYTRKNKKVLSGKIVLTLKDSSYTYTIASKPFNPKGLIGKVLYDTIEEFASELNALK